MLEGQTKANPRAHDEFAAREFNDSSIASSDSHDGQSANAANGCARSVAVRLSPNGDSTRARAKAWAEVLRRTNGSPNVLLDLASLTSLGRRDVAPLTRLLRRAARRGAQVTIVGATREAMVVLELNGIHHLAEVRFAEAVDQGEART